MSSKQLPAYKGNALVEPSSNKLKELRTPPAVTPAQNNEVPHVTATAGVALESRIEEAIRDGLSNHTGEWLSGFIVPGLSLSEEQSRDALFYLVKAKRLNKNIQQLIAAELTSLLTHAKTYQAGHHEINVEAVPVEVIQEATTAYEGKK